MAIVLITGAPGAGKTLLTLWDVEHRRQKEDRTVYYSGIANLNLPWVEFEAEKWNDLPDGAIIVIDECQRVLRPRFMGAKVPDYVEQFETHRHKGYDIYLITQHPMLIDNHVRRLAETHKHIMRKFGSKWATVHEWKGVKDNCDKTRKDSIASQWRYPKEVFGWYKSAELHTHTLKIPPKILLALIGLVCLFVFGGYWYYTRVHTASKGVGVTAPSTIVAGSGVQSNAAVVVPVKAVVSSGQSAQAYLSPFEPRVVGLPWTAPRYDELTTAKQVPVIRGCWLTDTPLDGFPARAVCMLDGGVYVYPPESFVKQYLRDRFFIDWENPRRGDLAAAQPKQGDIATYKPPPVSSLPVGLPAP